MHSSRFSPSSSPLPPQKKKEEETFDYRNISGEEFIFYYSLKLIPKNRRRVKLQASQFYINSKTVGLQRVKTVIILGKMVHLNTFAFFFIPVLSSPFSCLHLSEISSAHLPSLHCTSCCILTIASVLLCSPSAAALAHIQFCTRINKKKSHFPNFPKICLPKLFALLPPSPFSFPHLLLLLPTSTPTSYFYSYSYSYFYYYFFYYFYFFYFSTSSSTFLPLFWGSPLIHRIIKDPWILSLAGCFSLQVLGSFLWLLSLFFCLCSPYSSSSITIVHPLPSCHVSHAVAGYESCLVPEHHSLAC